MLMKVQSHSLHSELYVPVFNVALGDLMDVRGPLKVDAQEGIKYARAACSGDPPHGSSLARIS